MTKPRSHKQPHQPLTLDEYGTLRFQENKLVRYLLDNNGKIGLNELCVLDDIPENDWVQFYELIGYSLGGFGELSRIKDKAYYAAAGDQYMLPLMALPTPQEIEDELARVLAQYPDVKKEYKHWIDTLDLIVDNCDVRPWSAALTTLNKPYSDAALQAWKAIMIHAEKPKVPYPLRREIEAAICDQFALDDRLLDIFVQIKESKKKRYEPAQLRDYLARIIERYMPELHTQYYPLLQTLDQSWGEALAMYRLKQSSQLDLPDLTGPV